MRKSRRCSATKLQHFVNRLVARSCELSRGHAGGHHDKHGRWEL